MCHNRGAQNNEIITTWATETEAVMYNYYLLTLVDYASERHGGWSRQKMFYAT